LARLQPYPSQNSCSPKTLSIFPSTCYFYYFPYIKYKTYKTSSNSRRFGEVENFGNRPIVTALGTSPSCEKSVPKLAETLQEDCHTSDFDRGLHSFHMTFTDLKKEDCAAPCKSQKSPHLPA